MQSCWYLQTSESLPSLGEQENLSPPVCTSSTRSTALQQAHGPRALLLPSISSKASSTCSWLRTPHGYVSEQQHRPGQVTMTEQEPSPRLALLSALLRSTASLGRCLPCLRGLALLPADLALSNENATRGQPALCEARPTIDPKLTVLIGTRSMLALSLLSGSNA